MQKRLPCLIFMLLAIGSGRVCATAVFRCVGEDAVIKFQDKPCLADENSRKIELSDSASDPRSEASLPAEENQETTPASQSVVQSEVIVESGMSATLCKREDGSRYLSDSGRGQQRAVPLGMLGVPQDTLAEAYAGRDGIGVSAPGLRNPPTDRSAYGQLGAAYIWVEDPCIRINAVQLCRFLGERIEDGERRLRFAFSDTQLQVQQEIKSLQQRAKRCPR